MLNIIGNINSRNIITKDSVLVSSDVVNIFPRTDNVLDLEPVSEILHNRESDFAPAKYILDALKIGLECNNSVFNNHFYLQIDGTAIDPFMSFFYSGIAMYKFDVKALNYKTGLLCWKTFRDDVFELRNQSLKKLNKFFDFMNNIDTSGKVKFAMSVAKDSALEFLNLSLHINKQNCLCQSYYVCASFYMLSNILKSIALRFRRICDSDEKFDMRIDEYQNYLIARDCNISLVKKQFHSVRSISRSEFRQVSRKITKESFNLVTVYNPILNNLQKIIKNNLSLLYSDLDMRAIFPEGSINVTYRRGKNLKEFFHNLFFLSRSLQQNRSLWPVNAVKNVTSVIVF